MVKKNRHRAGRRKKERILRAQQRAALELIQSALPTPPVGRVAPIIRETPEPVPRGPAVPLVDLTEESIPVLDITEENTIPLNNSAADDEDEIEILNVLPLTSLNSLNTPPVEQSPPELEPLDPETEYRQNITRIFFDIDQYARSVFGDSLST